MSNEEGRKEGRKKTQTTGTMATTEKVIWNVLITRDLLW